MKVCAVSDLHGRLPVVPKCDLLLIAGDVTWHSDVEAREWLTGRFSQWLMGVPAKLVVGIAGNHDFVAQKDPDLMRRLPWHYLADETVRVGEHVIHGSPYANWFGNWAFMGHEDEMERRAAMIPDDTTILMTHGPPARTGDRVGLGLNVGSEAFERRACMLPNLRLYVFGHVHEDRGSWQRGVNGSQDVRATWANVSLVDLSYKPHPLQLFETVL